MKTKQVAPGIEVGIIVPAGMSEDRAERFVQEQAAEFAALLTEYEQHEDDAS